MLLAIKRSLLLFFAGGKPRKKIEPEQVKSVLFYRYDKIGDMIVSTPVFRALKKNRPDIKITVLASRSNAAAIKYNPYVDEVVVYPYGKFWAIVYLLLGLRGKVDCVIEFYHSVIWHAIFNNLLIRPKYIISTHKDGRYGVSGLDLSLYDAYSADANLNRHLSEIYLETLHPLGVYSSDAHYDFFCGVNEEKIADDFYHKLDAPVVLVNMRGSRSRIAFDNAAMREIIVQLKRRDSSVNVLLMGMPSDYAYLTDFVSSAGFSRVTLVPPCVDVVYAAAFVKKANVVITPDTSVVHIACAFDVPVVAVYIRQMDLFVHFSPRAENAKIVFCESESEFIGYSIEEICEHTLGYL